MTFDPAIRLSDSFQLRAYGFFLALVSQAERHQFREPGAEPSLGGKLLYAGEIHADSQALVVAGNVAGCATLAATGDSATQQQAIRDGAVDFLVTSLDEALRILKNEIRKRNAVAVCVAAQAEVIEREMRERGVQPDVVSAGKGDDGQRRMADFGAGSVEIQTTEPEPGLALVNWQVSEAPARWMPKLDAIVLDCLSPDSWEHRWIRLFPRYCGKTAMTQRTLYCAPQVAQEIIRRVADSVQKGEISVEVALSIVSGGESEVFRTTPRGVGQDKP